MAYTQVSSGTRAGVAIAYPAASGCSPKTLPKIATASVVDVVGKRRDDTSVELTTDVFQQETDGPIKWIPFCGTSKTIVQHQINSCTKLASAKITQSANTSLC